MSGNVTINIQLKYVSLRIEKEFTTYSEYQLSCSIHLFQPLRTHQCCLICDWKWKMKILLYASLFFWKAQLCLHNSKNCSIKLQKRNKQKEKYSKHIKTRMFWKRVLKKTCDPIFCSANCTSKEKVINGCQYYKPSLKEIRCQAGAVTAPCKNK